MQSAVPPGTMESADESAGTELIDNGFSRRRLCRFATVHFARLTEREIFVTNPVLNVLFTNFGADLGPPS